jgi:hypothetical protein
MSTITRSRVRHSAIETDAAKVARVEAVAREWQRLVRWQVRSTRKGRAGQSVDPYFGGMTSCWPTMIRPGSFSPFASRIATTVTP